MRESRRIWLVALASRWMCRRRRDSRGTLEGRKEISLTRPTFCPPSHTSLPSADSLRFASEDVQVDDIAVQLSHAGIDQHQKRRDNDRGEADEAAAERAPVEGSRHLGEGEGSVWHRWPDVYTVAPRANAGPLRRKSRDLAEQGLGARVEVGTPHSHPSARGRIRTCDLRLRRPTLYPAELRAQINLVLPHRPRSEVQEQKSPCRAHTRVGQGDRCFSMVGATGFEPATSCSRSRRSTGLSYAPPIPHPAQ